MKGDTEKRGFITGYKAATFFIILTTSCSSSTAVPDAGEFEASYFGEIFLDDLDRPQVGDILIASFRTRQAQQIAERCEDSQEMALGECRVVTPTYYPWDDCGDDCQLCGFTEDCEGGRCIAGDPTMMAEAGDITIRGGERTYTLTEIPGTSAYVLDVVSATAFEPGDVLDFSAPGASFPGFQLTTELLPPPQVTSDTRFWTTGMFDGTHDVHVEWTPSNAVSHIELALYADNGVRMVCSTDDDGDFDLPAASIDEVSGSLPSEIHLELTRINEMNIRPTPDAVLTARFVSSVRINVAR